MKIFTLRREGSTAPVITIDPRLAETLQAKGWSVEERVFDDDAKAGLISAIAWYSIIIGLIIGCCMWLYAKFGGLLP